MKHYFNRILLFTTIISFTLLANSCSNDEEINNATHANNQKIIYKGEEINSFSYSDLKLMKSQLEKSNIEVSNVDLNVKSENSIQSKEAIDNNPCVVALKVTCKTPHPDRSGRYIDASGVLLVPKKKLLTDLKNYRIIIATPPTYTYNNLAPSIAFKKVSLIDGNNELNYLYFWTLQAQSGFAVLIPDYPGFGDSYGQCFHPYLDSKAMVNSTLDLLKSAESTLSANGYRYKKELMITGYSLGGYVAASLARKIETDLSNKYTVKLLFTGGTPCNLKQIADIVRHSNYTQHTFFLSYGLWGYKKNAYPQIKITDYLKPPYDTQSLTYFNGTYVYVNEFFPHNPADIYTEKFIKYLDTDPDLAIMNSILDENSVKPWKNKCRFIMIHGVSDVSVYYQNAKDFANQQNQYGGNVTFYNTVGDHIVAVEGYYLKASQYLKLYE